MTHQPFVAALTSIFRRSSYGASTPKRAFADPANVPEELEQRGTPKKVRVVVLPRRVVLETVTLATGRSQQSLR